MVDYLNRSDLYFESSFEKTLQFVADTYSLEKNQYADWLVHSSKEQFFLTQVPFLDVVESYFKSLSAVLAKAPDIETGADIFDNISEEYGRGNLKMSHRSTFAKFLETVGDDGDEADSYVAPHALAFNESIRNFCLVAPYYEGAAMLGMIELLYVDMSKIIAEHIANMHWVDENYQGHYSVHQSLDVEHARELFDVAEQGWKGSCNRRAIADAMMLGAYYFNSLYDAMLPAVK